MEKTAEISSCEKYRYSLTRKWAEGPSVVFVMLNPSTADANDDDPTIRRCISFAQSWGYKSLTVGNLFAYRTPSPDELMESENPIGDTNDEWLDKLQKSANLTVAAWGNKGRFLGRSKKVAQLLNKPHYLRMTSIGEPSHPFYLPAELKPTPWVLSF